MIPFTKLSNCLGKVPPYPPSLEYRELLFPTTPPSAVVDYSNPSNRAPLAPIDEVDSEEMERSHLEEHLEKQEEDLGPEDEH